MKTAICAIIKDEHLFLEEWIEWHLGLGFDAIHLFEDKGSDSHEEITSQYENVFLRRYEDSEQVQELLEAQGSSHRQFVLYTWFANQYNDVYDWCAFIDLDEFVMFADDYNLEQLCVEFEPYPTVLLNWKMIGASGRISKPTCGVIEAYTQECDYCDNDKMWSYKSFVNLKKFEGFHDLHLALGYVNTHHSNDKNEHYYDKAWLNHYFTKSLEDWTERIFKKGGTLNGHRKLTHFFECNKNMKYLESLYIKKHSEETPNGTYRIGNGFIAGGNVQKIALLNAKSIGDNHLDSQERLEKAIKKAAEYGFEDRGRDRLVHVFWLGRKRFPELMQKCIESWKKYLTNETLCLWTEESCDMSHPFVRIAYDCKSYAFAVDYLRLMTIYKYGGIYIDVDVELLKPINSLPDNFVAIEKELGSVAFGLIFGASKGNEVIGDISHMYDHIFYEHDKRYDIIQPHLVTEYFKSHGLEYNGEIQDFLGFTVYPSKYFSPMNFFTKELEVTEETISIHHYLHSWR